jgi:hypothetical protein
MQTFQFGQKSISTIDQVKNILAPYPLAERVSIIKFLGLDLGLTLATTTGAVNRAHGVRHAGVAKKKNWVSKRRAA